MTETVVHHPSPQELAEEGRAIARVFDRDRGLLMLSLLDLLAERGGPVPRADVDAAIAEAGIDRAVAAEFLDGSTECDASGAVVGFGLTGNRTPHSVDVGGSPLTTPTPRSMWTWCALDTLLFPVWLHREFAVTSTGPGETTPVCLLSRPDGPVEIAPQTAVITWSMRSKNEFDLGSVEAIWRTACHHSYFFTAPEHAARWAAGRDDVAIVPIEDGFTVARAFAEELLAIVGDDS